MRQERQGVVNICFWNICHHILSAMWNIYHHSLSGNTQHIIHDISGWGVCVCVCRKEREKEMVQGISTLVWISVTPNIYLLHSALAVEIPTPSVMVLSGGTFSASSKSRRKEHCQTHFMRPTLFWYQNQTGNISSKQRDKNPQQNIKKHNSIMHPKDHARWSSEICSKGCKDGSVFTD